MAEKTWGIRCRCGRELVGLGEHALVSTVETHLREVHPALVGAYTAEDVLSLAYRKPAVSPAPRAPGHRPGARTRERTER